MKKSKSLRDELNKYVADIATKKGSDGENLVRIPSNFEAIVDSMNREDLTSTNDEKPWSQYLLLDSLNEEDGAEFEGRYKNMHWQDDTSMKINKGLAKIKLLDRQLQDASRKTESNKLPIGLVSYSEEGHTKETFITKVNSVDTDSNDQFAGSASSPSSSRSTPRSSSKAPKARKGTSSAADIAQIHARRGLNEEQESRILYLLSENEEKDEYLQFLHEAQEADAAIDVKLATFGRLSRITGSSDEALRECNLPSSSRRRIQAARDGAQPETDDFLTTQVRITYI